MHRLALDDTLSAFLLLKLLNSSLSLFSLQQQLLLMLLLTKSVQEFMRLGENLRNKSVFIEVLDVENFPVHLITLMGSLIDISHQVFVLEVNSPEFSVIVLVFIILRRPCSAMHLFLVIPINFCWR